FGGGKTHSMLALYHLFSADRASDLVGIEAVLAEAGVKQVPRARIAVLVGTALSPGQTHQKPDGTVIHTLWGELAWQLGNYGLVAEADRHGVSPGSDALRALFRETSGEAGPCLVLIDEWLAHARQLAGKDGMPAGSLAANLSFAQALTEAARAVAGTLVVVTIPESEIEKGGEAGRDVLEHLKNVLGRMDSPWRPASAEESFEIVRRRLFEEPGDAEAFKARDAVARAFGELYRSQAQELPAACREAVYERRIRACYPIHPELFDRLFHDWSSLDRFQRTRGVLRLMAKVIHTLWERNDQSLLILPGFVPLDDPAVHEELTRYLEDPWRTVIDTDVDGTSSLPYRLDGDNPSLGRFSASRRVARTVFLGSAATFQTAHRGIEDTQVKLGCIQPGETPAVFGDALRRLTDQAHHLYVDGRRYWYSTQPSVARLAQDRAQQQREDVVHEAIAERLRAEQRQRGDFARVHACPSSPADVGDDREARLVILGPEAPHAGNGKPSPAREAAERYLTERGTGPRRYRNTLVFLAADARRLEELESAVRQHLAWKSILAERRELNLDAYSETQAKTKTEESDSTVDHRIRETFTWLLVPGQQEPTAEVACTAVRVQGQDALAVRAARKLAQDELLLTGMAGSVLRLHLDRVPLWRGDHVETGQLAEHFAQYLYLPRLRDDSVLRDAIQEGVNRTNWNPDTFAYADRWDEAKGRYVGLEGGRIVSVQLGGGAVVVKPEAAATQRAAEQKVAAGSGKITGGGDLAGVGSAATGSPGGPPPPEEAVRERYSHFYAAKSIDPQRVARDVQQINDEVLQHFVALAEAGVDVTLDIRVDLPDDLPDTLVRTITENCRTLGFKTFEFEKE
ncbi:MAG: ATP-binding protein, partial [Thermoanaerobaculia bacterium]